MFQRGHINENPSRKRGPTHTYLTRHLLAISQLSQCLQYHSTKHIVARFLDDELMPTSLTWVRSDRSTEELESEG